ncbi:unnamed protein product [Protopolystoma xenopodis]|uniref:Uncharacterized protein n=1 Tax=Protopolystoma xenopodis TaxID=117903 RepID=A0A3S5BSF2_9PLAT|nr:unnamed protein product [Protopolystoma xenopodis]
MRRRSTQGPILPLSSAVPCHTLGSEDHQGYLNHHRISQIPIPIGVPIPNAELTNDDWLSPPPTWSCIRGPQAPNEHTLTSYWCMLPVSSLMSPPKDLMHALDAAGPLGLVLTAEDFGRAFL